MEDKDEYIASLLLSLFLMQGEVDRLNDTLDLARKGELVYIKNPQIEELKAENERLKEEVIHQRKINQELIIKYVQPFAVPTLNTELFDKNYKLKHTLQEIKAIAERELSLTAEGEELYDVFSEIILKITKAESEG